MTISSCLKARSAGFTLLEVLTVCVIVGILAAIALPSYGDYVRRGQIQEGTTALSDGAVRMEQWFQDKRTYEGGPCPELPSAHFDFSGCADATATAFTLIATGKDNVLNFNYTINSSGGRTSDTPWAGVGLPCWIMRKGDTC